MSPLDRYDLAAMRERLKRATPGPWRVAEGWIRSADGQKVCDRLETSDANAEFIAHAPHDIARLLAEVERLRRGEVGE